MYAERLGDDFDLEYPYRVSHGILLKSDLHKQYDDYAFSFHTQVRRYCLVGSTDCTGSNQRRYGFILPYADLVLCLQENDESYYVHVFNERFLGDYHGKIIPRTRFSPVAETWELPDQRLCKWHYAQCILQNLRGFASSPRIRP